MMYKVLLVNDKFLKVSHPIDGSYISSYNAVSEEEASVFNLREVMKRLDILRRFEEDREWEKLKVIGTVRVK